MFEAAGSLLSRLRCHPGTPSEYQVDFMWKWDLLVWFTECNLGKNWACCIDGHWRLLCLIMGVRTKGKISILEFCLHRLIVEGSVLK